MAIFGKEKLKVISDKDLADLSKASINKNLSAVDFDSDGKYFYITIDSILNIINVISALQLGGRR